MANQLCNLGKNKCECKTGFSANAVGHCKLDAVLGTPLAGKKIVRIGKINSTSIYRVRAGGTYLNLVRTYL